MLMKCLAGDFLLDMEREEIEEKCLKQQQMIMEQMKNLKKVYFRDKNEKCGSVSAADWLRPCSF